MEENYATPGDSASTDQSAPPPPAWAVPAKRTDDVGNLAWQLVSGGPDGMPDFTAAGRLYDALTGEGDTEGAMRLRASLAGLAADIGRFAAEGPRGLKRWLREVGGRTIPKAMHLLYDFDSCMGVLARAVEVASTPVAPPVAEEASATVVRADIGYTHVGQRVTLSDGRRGVVIQDADSQGVSRVLLDTP